MKINNTLSARDFDWHFGEQCGLNADWSVSAWQVSDGIAGDDGATFMLDAESDGEMPAFYIVRRWNLHEVNCAAYQSEGNATLERDRASDPEAFDGHNDAVVTLAELASAQDAVNWVDANGGK
tara:strand:+ start:482 stop:850 length:369 start_codon:yes stop_codon:yes gene_type:complete